jgi:hypothetical protein
MNTIVVVIVILGNKYMIKKGMCRQNHYKWLLGYKEKEMTTKQ